MTNQHPITPPRELTEQWALEKSYDERDWLYELHIAARAAQWGADIELEACCEWLKVQETRSNKWFDSRHDACALAGDLRAARRPKLPSLKEQALAALNEIEDRNLGPTVQEKLIRRALEALPE